MRKAAILLLLLFGAARAEAYPIPDGEGRQWVPLRGIDFDVLTYRPNCPDPMLLLIFHGSARNAEVARQSVRGLADKVCLLVLAPRFDPKRFPPWRYNTGGIVETIGGGIRFVHAREQWSGHFALALVEWARALERAPKLAYYLVGHSAGGQFLSKLAAFIPNEARRIVIANPLIYLEASVAVRAPAGLGGVYATDEARAQLQNYLNQPVTLLLGNRDTRYAEGLRLYARASDVAASRGWSFNWRLIEVPGIGHDADAMFSSREAGLAIRP